LETKEEESPEAGQVNLEIAVSHVHMHVLLHIA